jgi:hypothetical protein
LICVTDTLANGKRSFSSGGVCLLYRWLKVCVNDDVWNSGSSSLRWFMRSAVELLMNIFFPIFFIFFILEIDANSFKNLLCPPVCVYINFDSYSFDFHLFLLLMHFDLQLFCNFIYKNFISFNFYIKLDPYFFVFILF